MLIGLLATGIVSKVPYISLKVDDLRDDLQSLAQARIQIAEIASESDTEYGYANDGRVTVSFNVNPLDNITSPDRGITYVVGDSESPVITNTTRGTNVTFTGFNAGLYPLSITDNTLNCTFNATLTIGYGSGQSYVRYKNADYIGVGSVYFMPVIYNTVNNSGATFSITNIRNGFVAINCNNITSEPSNKPLTGTYLAQQNFNISDLNGRSSIAYPTTILDPVTRVTHNLVISAGYTPYVAPSLKINYLNSETVNDLGSISLTFNSNELLSSNVVSFSLNNGTNTVVQTATIGASAIFTDLDSLETQTNTLTVTDLAKNRIWNLNIRVGYGDSISYIQYNNDNVLYQTGDTILFGATPSLSSTPQTKLLYQNKVYNKGDILLLR